MKKLLNRKYNQAVYQGTGKEKNYFEGWYYKNVTGNGKTVIAIIPGVSISEHDSHAFVQIIENINYKTYYIKYPIEDFKYEKDKLKAVIGDNIFEEDKIILNINNEDINIQGTLYLTNHIYLEKTRYRPNIMGPFAYLKKMECNHGVVSLYHDINGSINLNNEPIDFNHGSGYIEKDYGSSFPNKYMWLESNNSNNKENSSFMFSYATIPLPIIKFNGLISFLNTPDKQYVFASYYGARVRKVFRYSNKTIVEMKQGKYLLTFECSYPEGLSLAAPSNGEMAHKINECLDAKIKVTLYKRKKIVYENSYIQAGYEDVGGLK